MAIRVTCPECGAGRDVTEEQRGKKVRCKKCDELILVPAKAKAPAPDDDDDDIEVVEPVKKKAPARAAARDEDEDDDEVIEDVTPVKKQPAKPAARSDGNGIQKAPAKKKPAAAAAKPTKRRDDDYEDEDEEDDAPRGKKGKKKAPRSTGATIAIVAVLIVVILAGLGTGGYFFFKGDNEDKNVAGGNPNAGGGNPNPGGGIPNPNGFGGGKPNPDGGKPNPDGGGKPNPDGGQKPPVVDPGPAPPPQISRSTVYNYVLRSTAWIVTRLVDGGAMGSGELIDRDNRLVLTNYHVVHGMIDFIVMFPEHDKKDGKLIKERNYYITQARADNVIKGKVVAIDKGRDLALIQLDRVPDGAEALPFAKTEPQEGDQVHSIGNPGASDQLWVYTNGKVRGIYKKEWLSGGADFVLDLKAKVVETDSPVNPGDSGGPCVNDRGELIGTTQGKSTRGAQISIFVYREESEDFIGNAFRQSPMLAGKSWARSQRPTLVASGGGDAAKLPSLVKKLGDADDTVRAEGAQGLALLGPDAHLALPELVKALGDKNPFVRRLVAHALRQTGQPTADDIAELLPALESASPEARAYVLEALAVLGDKPQAAAAGPAVLKATEDPDLKVRFHAMRALGKMAASVGANEAQAALEKGLMDPDKKVRSAAAESLITAIPSIKTDVAKLTGLLKHQWPEVRTEAAKGLALLQERAKPATPDLIAALQEKNRDLRRACFVALKAIKADPASVVPRLRDGIKDEDTEVRRGALELAGQAHAAAKDLVPLIADCLTDPDVRIPALTALKDIGPDAQSGAPAVANLLATDKTLRVPMLTTIEAMKVGASTAPLVVPKIIAIFEDEKQVPVRDKAAAVLGSIGKPALDPLVRALLNPNANVRRGAAKSLGAMGAEARPAVQYIEVTTRTEKDQAALEEEQAAMRRILGAPPIKP
jgi:predicted Zn finger-like uncharacterized protein